MQLAADRRTGNAFRPGTRANHRSHVLLFTAFTGHFGLCDFPASPRTLVLFGEFLLRGFKAAKSVVNTLASVRAFHLDRGLDTAAFDSRQLSLFRRSLRLTLRHVPTRATPLTLAGLERMCRAALSDGPAGLAFAALLSVCYFAMARLSSLVPPTAGRYDFTRWPSFADLRVVGGITHLNIKWGKCQQEADRAFLVPLLPLGGSQACPVTLLTRLAGSATGVPGLTPLFSYTAGGGGTRTTLTAGRARRRLTTLLRRLGIADGGFTFHSLRRGACSRAYEHGASLPDLQFMGGWRGDSVQLYAPAATARARAAACLALPSPPLNNLLR